MLGKGTGAVNTEIKTTLRTIKKLIIMHFER